MDSSVAALLLKEQGYEVIGMTMELWHENICNLPELNLDAKQVCHQIGIPYQTCSFQKEFKQYVIDDFIDTYASCKTPNPCIECNKYLKFGKMYEKAREIGCDFLATGHYAKTEYSQTYHRWVLKKSKAGKKDQSYVLWSIPKELLEYLVFPLGDFENKEQIRKIAIDHHLKVANKPDSEDICFIPDGDYKKFLESHSSMKAKEGNIVTMDGQVLGKHKGMYHYTIGQRRGLGVSYRVPLFVIGFQKERNEVIVGEEDKLYQKEVMVSDSNLLLVDQIIGEMEVEVKTRYSTHAAKAKISQMDQMIKIVFDEPQRALTPGQSAVFYQGDIVVGGRKDSVKNEK